MPVVTPIIKGRKPVDAQFPHECATFTWADLADGDEGEAVQYGSFSDRSVQFVGTFGGGTVMFEGSNDGVNYATLSDPQGNPLSKTSAGIEAVLEATRYVRPRVSGGAGGAITVILFVRD